MKYPYIVVKDGIWYPAGTDVPADTFTEPELPFVTVPNDKKYTKTEINRMSTADLKEFALEQEIDKAEEMTGAELKKVLIEKLGL